MASLSDSVAGNKEKVEFLTYFVVTIVSAYYIAQILARGWGQGHLVKVLFRHVPVLVLGLSFAAVTSLLIGFYLGLLVLMNIDPKKRWQGRLLIIGTVIGVLVLQAQGLLNFPLVPNLPWLIAGGIVGFLVGGGEKLIRQQTAEALEFRRASSLLFYLLAALTVGALIEAHVSYPFVFDVSYNPEHFRPIWPYPPANAVRSFGFSLSPLLDYPVAVVFLFTLSRFIQYDAQRSFFIIGPRQSGKTLFLIGAYLEALEGYSSNGFAETPMNPTQDLIQMVDALDRNSEEWIVEATEPGEVRELAFRYVHGAVFPLNIYVRGLDYAGEHLDSIPDALTGTLNIEDYPNPAIMRALVTNIEMSDTLIFLIDTNRFLDDDASLAIGEYFDILQALDDKDVMLVATKCDLLAEEFQEETGLQAFQYFDDFTEYVNQQLRQSQQIEALIKETAGSEIHPVYYQTTETDDGERVPMRDQSNSVMVVGFDELLDKLGR